MYDINHIYRVGNLIASLREEKGLSQSELGSMLGVTNKAVSRWENGRGYPDTSLLIALSEALGITVDELLRGELSTSIHHHKVDNRRVNYQAEKALFVRFSFTAIPSIAMVLWLLFWTIDPLELLFGLGYGEAWFVVFFMPALLSCVATVLLGLLLCLKLHKRSDIKLSVKVLIGAAALIGFGLYYLVIYVYMLIRLLRARKRNKSL